MNLRMSVASLGKACTVDGIDSVERKTRMGEKPKVRDRNVRLCL